MSFDPEKVERPYVKEWGHYAVYMSDYDQLLMLYRQEKARAEALVAGVQKLLPLVIASPFSAHL